MNDFWTRFANIRAAEKEQREFVEGILPERFDEYKKRCRQENLYFPLTMLCLPALIVGALLGNTLITVASPIAFLAAIVKGFIASKAKEKIYEEAKRTKSSRERNTHLNVQVIRDASALTLESLK